MSSQANQPLPEGFQVEHYRILRVIAAGGFSFVYLAHDDDDAPVALKEYLPATLALRTDGATAPVVPEDKAAIFRRGMKYFFEEGRALAGLRHPNVVRVLNFFRANGTAYMAMRYERGRTLEAHIRRRSGPLAEDWLRATFVALLKGLREVHARRLLHLDIKPANIYLRNDGEPLLIDFGAARQALSGEAALAPIHTPGFASPEQHGAGGELGPWSDIYSVGATLYACLAGAPPAAAPERLAKDRLAPARKAWAGRHSAQLLDTVDWCLRLDAGKRPQSVLELQKALTGERAPAWRGAAPVLDRIRDAIVRLAGR